MKQVKITKIHGGAIIPKYAHKGDAGVDLHAIEFTVIYPGGRRLVRTGLTMEIPSGYEGQIRPRSGLALKKGLSIPNSPGTIDSGYRGEICVIMVNLDPHATIEINPGDRIAQMIFNKIERARFKEVVNLGKSSRSAKGFGSSGK